MLLIYSLVIIATSFVTLGHGHTMGLGSCPRVEPQKDFDMNKLLGEWYVIEKFSTASACMKYNFTKDADDKLRLVQTKQHFIFDTIGIDHVYTYTGVLTVPDEDKKSRMRVKFPLNIAGESDFIIFDTDYENYAGVFTCQKILFGHSKSATILSRKPTMDRAIISKLRQALEEQGVDPDDFSVVDQSKCKANKKDMMNVKIDDDTFSPANVAGVVKKVGGALGTGLEKAGDVLGSGIAKASDVTGDLIVTFSENNKKTSPKTLSELLENAKDHENDAEWLP